MDAPSVGLGRRLLLVGLLSFYALLYAGGLISYVILGGPPADSLWTAPAFLMLAALLVLWGAARRDRQLLVGCGLLALAVECVGVTWGFPFGRYRYTDALFPQVLGVPLAVGCAWIVLLAYVSQLVERCRLALPWRLVAAGAWMVGLDLVVDPLASGPLGYWRWLDGGRYHGIPASNFLGWFVLSVLLFMLLGRPRSSGLLIRRIGLSVLLFFGFLALLGRLWTVVLIASLLVLLHLLLVARGASRQQPVNLGDAAL